MAYHSMGAMLRHGYGVVAYIISDSLPVYYVQDASRMHDYLQQLPTGTQSVTAGDGVKFIFMRR